MIVILKFLERLKFEEKIIWKFEWNLNKKRVSWIYDFLGK